MKLRPHVKLKSATSLIFVLVLLILLLVQPVHAQGGEGKSDAPPGQSTRRGLIGPVVSKGSNSITVSTKFGNVEVKVTGSTTITSSIDETADFGSISVGDRVAVLLSKPISSNKPTEGKSGGDDDEADKGEDEDIDSASDDAATSTDEMIADDELGSDNATTTTGDLSDQEASEVESSTSTDSQSDEQTQEPDDGDVPEQSSTSTEDVITDDDSDRLDEDVATSTEDMQESDSDRDDDGTESGTSTPPELTPIETVPTFRTATADRIRVIPSKANRTHERVVVTGKENRKLKILNEDGELEEVDVPEGSEFEDGDDLILLLKGNKGSGRRRELRGSQSPDSIQDRIQRFIDAVESQGDTTKLGRLLKKLNDHVKDRGERLDRTFNNARSEDKDKVDRARNRGKGGGGEDNQRDSDGDSESGKNKGKSDDDARGGGSDNKKEDSDRGSGSGGKMNDEDGRGGGKNK